MNGVIKKFIYRVLSSNIIFSTLSLFRGQITFSKRIINLCPPKGRFRVEINDRQGFLLNSASFIESSMYWNGLESNWERAEIEAWSIAARYSEFMIDIGANTGIYSLIFNAINNKAHSISYEPVNRNYTKLQNNLEINEFFRCIPKNYAVSDREGEVSILVPEGVEVPYSASLVSNYYKSEVVQQVTVKTESIDSLQIKQQKLLVKIDVEGAEFLVLRGMKNTLANCDFVVFIEITFNSVDELREFTSIFSPEECLFFRLSGKINKIESLDLLLGTSHVNILILRKGGYAENLYAKLLAKIDK